MPENREVRFAVLLFSFAFAAAAQHNPPSEGREISKLYEQNCSSCHGTDLHGGTAPGLVESKWRFGGDDASLARSIHEGHESSGMPAFRQTLSNAEIRGLVIYIREKAHSFDLEHTQYPKPSSGEVVRSEREAFQLEPVVESGLAEPWAIAFLPDGRMLVTERAGRLRVIDHGHLLPEAIPGTPDVFGGEGGLLDVVLHPDYRKPSNGWIYFTYAIKNADGQGMTAVMRARLRDGALTDQQPIFRPDEKQFRPGGMRFGSRLLFDGKGHLFFSIGDRGAPGDEQDLSRPNGKIHRVMDDGKTPPDNPFVKIPDALSSIWSYGHRNPQGLTFEPATGVVWEAEHGPRGGDELNIIQPGRNYGWPVITYGMNYDGTPITDHLAQPGIEQPVEHWVPSIAVSTILFYNGARFPKWRGNLFLGSLAAQELRRLEIAKGKVVHQEVLFKKIGRVRNLAFGPDGDLYIVFNQPDRIMRLVPAGGSPSATSAHTTR